MMQHKNDWLFIFCITQDGQKQIKKLFPASATLVNAIQLEPIYFCRITQGGQSK
jgi:hypothetical protein